MYPLLTCYPPPPVVDGDGGSEVYMPWPFWAKSVVGVVHIGRKWNNNRVPKKKRTEDDPFLEMIFQQVAEIGEHFCSCPQLSLGLVFLSIFPLIWFVWKPIFAFWLFIPDGTLSVDVICSMTQRPINAVLNPSILFSACSSCFVWLSNVKIILGSVQTFDNGCLPFCLHFQTHCCADLISSLCSGMYFA